ncbi:MAG: hypothetical protein HQK77_10320 [Desulfobacterales bacterium]|nr:hypothetical protein [Desulfobacterales bacterium]
MLVIPKEKPVVKDLNSYYLYIEKLFEHYHGALGTGCVHFKTPSAEGAVFFDEDNLLNGFLLERNQISSGKEAINRLVELSPNNNFSVSVYEIEPDMIYYWANLPMADGIYKELSTEFTDLESLIKKLKTEKLTGYLTLDIKNQKTSGVIFLMNGFIIGASSNLADCEIDFSSGLQEKLIQQATTHGATLNVYKIAISNSVELETISLNSGNLPEEEKTNFTPTDMLDQHNIVEMLQRLLVIFEKVIRDNRKIKIDFDTLLKRKFMQKVSQFDFLDPFSGEFQYSGGKISYSGDTKYPDLIKGVSICIKELASEYHITKLLENYLKPWKKLYAREIQEMGIVL